MQPPFSATLTHRFLHVSSRALALHILWPPLLFHPFPFYPSALCAAAPCTETGSYGLQVQQSCDLCGDSLILFDSQAVFNIQGPSFVLWSFVMNLKAEWKQTDVFAVVPFMYLCSTYSCGQNYWRPW